MNGEPNAVARILDGYCAQDPIEAVDVARLQTLLGDDLYTRSSPVHVTGSAFVVHRPTARVLLRWHPRMERWMQVGGHFDAGETDPLAVALREAREETGLADLRAAADEPIQVVIVPVPAHGDEPAHEHADFRYLLETDAPDATRAESDAAKLRWLAIDDAIAEIIEPNLREFLTRLGAIARGA